MHYLFLFSQDNDSIELTRGSAHVDSSVKSFFLREQFFPLTLFNVPFTKTNKVMEWCFGKDVIKIKSVWNMRAGTGVRHQEKCQR
jgi:hypothetical protein